MSSAGSTADSLDPEQKAQFACSSCRTQKKGCDKALPACSSCVRLKRTCDYSSPAPTPAPAQYQKLVERVAHLENEIAQSRLPRASLISPRSHSAPLGPTREVHRYPVPNTLVFPSSFFLDVEMFKKHRPRVPRPRIAVPDDVLHAIGDDMEIRTIIGSYFYSVSIWMTIVSKKRIYEDAARCSVEIEADVVLLVLSMKLVIEKPIAGQESAYTPLYLMAKDFYARVEPNGVWSIRLLQAGILIALYELGHAIYPEAYLSIGHCGRLGQAIGLHDTAGVPQLSWEPESWDDMEERRRVWWAVFILDRKVFRATSRHAADGLQIRDKR